jgi:DNA (cytosine-5)-methyltransferase 1
MTTVYATSIGENSKGTGRLWLQGEKLLRGQFPPTTTYRRIFKNGALIMVADQNGEYVVSGRKARGGVDRIEPIIDICNKEIEKHFPIGTKLRAVVRKGKIIVRRAVAAIKSSQRKNRLIHKLATGAALSAVSLYHGIGAMDRALHDGLTSQGINVRSAVVAELEPTYLDASMRANAHLFDEDTVFFSGPIQDFELGKVTPCELLWAGIPCTGASTASRARLKTASAEEHPDAGTMFFTTLEWIKKFDYPGIVVLENVKAYRSTASMTVIRSLLDAWGYQVSEMILSGVDHGSLENRDRLVIVATQKELSKYGFNPATILPLRKKEATIGEILDPIGPDDDRWKAYDYIVDKAVRDKSAGKGFAMQTYTAESESVSVLVRGYAKIQSTNPFLEHPTKPGLLRLFTPEEHERLKALPEGFVKALALSNSRAHQGLGQSVIYPVFQSVGTAIGGFLQSIKEAEAQSPRLTLVA